MWLADLQCGARGLQRINSEVQPSSSDDAAVSNDTQHFQTPRH